MNEEQLKEFFTAIGTLAETSLIFYRSAVISNATPEEAMRITQAFIAATLNGGKNEKKEGV